MAGEDNMVETLFLSCAIRDDAMVMGSVDMGGGMEMDGMRKGFFHGMDICMGATLDGIPLWLL